MLFIAISGVLLSIIGTVVLLANQQYPQRFGAKTARMMAYVEIACGVLLVIKAISVALRSNP